MEKLVSVIIPSYNRAHILARTITSYMQDGVGEIIVIDDCSTDDTQKVLHQLKEKIPCLVIKRNQSNRRQTYSKNRGIHIASYPYIYFGDDDSIITDGTIPNLLNYIKDRPDSIICARPIYLWEEHQIRHIEQHIRATEIHSADEGYRFFDMESMATDSSVYYTKLTKVDMVPACFMISSENARKLSFDRSYRDGNSFREETDFIMQAAKIGIPCYFAPNACQINYPRAISDRGTKKRAGVRYYWGRYKNTKHFLDKHYDFMRSKRMVCSHKCMILMRYLWFEIKRNIKTKKFRSSYE